MTPREQTGDSEFNRLVLAYNNFTNLLCEILNVIGHREMICGNAALRKQDMQAIAGVGDPGGCLTVTPYWMLVSPLEEGRDGRRDNTL
jgi:hypothetical protein